VAAVKEGTLTIHRIRRNMDDPNAREITIIKMEIQQIMKGVTKNPLEYTTINTNHDSQATTVSSCRRKFSSSLSQSSIP
jgi:hypothetical protein